MWKIYPNNNNYECSSEGEVRNVKTKRILKLKTRSDGYQQVNLYKDGIATSKRVHRMILETFKPIADADSFDVNHINGIKTDNSVENLEWLSAKVNRGVLMNEQRGEITLLINQLIQKYGFEETEKKLKKLLTND